MQFNLWRRRAAALCLPLMCSLAVSLAGCAAEEAADDATAPVNGDPVALETDQEKIIYALGASMAKQVQLFHLSEQEQSLMIAGLSDGLAGEAKVEVNEFQQQIQQLAQERFAKAGEEEAQLAATFVEHMATQPGAEKLDSGMVMTEITPGTGDSPTATSKVRVHYHGTLRSGQVFDSSVDRGEPVEFGLNQVVPCWTEGLQRMKVGGKSRLVCPPALAYGSQGRPPQIPANAALVFEVELLDIVSP